MIEIGTAEYQEWVQARLGKATASRIGDVIAKAKNGAYRATRAGYRGELVAERRTASHHSPFALH